MAQPIPEKSIDHYRFRITHFDESDLATEHIRCALPLSIANFDEWLVDREVGEVEQLFDSVNGALSTRRRPQGGRANEGSGKKGLKGNALHFLMNGSWTPGCPPGRPTGKGNGHYHF